MKLDKKYFSHDHYNGINEECLSVSWSLGGTSGSCWGGGLTQHSGDKEPDFEELNNLLLKICPNITFLQYKKIESKIQYKESSHGDYYGGTMSRGVKYITKEDLEDVLNELGF